MTAFGDVKISLRTAAGIEQWPHNGLRHTFASYHLATFGDALKTARVRGKIAAHGRGDKILVFKFKRKKQYKRTIGHRQNYTRVSVEEIVA